MPTDKNIKVSVPQSDGEIVIAHGGTEANTYKVSGGSTTVKESDLTHFLAVVDGATADSGGK
jgi:hypothetical protein